MRFSNHSQSYQPVKRGLWCDAHIFRGVLGLPPTLHRYLCLAVGLIFGGAKLTKFVAGIPEVGNKTRDPGDQWISFLEGLRRDW